MAPRRTARVPASLNLRVLVELIIPDHIWHCVIVHFIKGCADGVICRVPGAIGAFLKRLIVAAGVNELLAEGGIILDLAAKNALSLGTAAASRKHARIQF